MQKADAALRHRSLLVLVPMTDPRFRLLMMVSLGLLVLGVAADLIALHSTTAPAPVGSSWGSAATAGAILSSVYLFLFSASFIGVYLFKSWGRSLSLAVTIALPLLGTAASAAYGSGTEVVASSIYSPPVQELSQLTWGAVLALAYWSPVSSRFRSRNPSKPTSLRGAT